MTLKIIGGTPLTGHIDVLGNKNAILKLLPASIVATGPITLTNVPDIRDVTAMCEILQSLGAKIEGLHTSTLHIDPTSINTHRISPELTKKVRASIVFLAPLLAKFGKVEIGFPGGDVIGKRAFGTHLEALSQLGAQFKITPESIVGVLKMPSKPVNIFLDEASVTATENALILASCLPIQTTIEDAACEPHVKNLGEFLIKLGAEISGLGTGIISIRGTKNPGSTTHAVCPDFMDAGTFAIAAAATHGHITISPVSQEDMRMFLIYLSRFNVKFAWSKPDTLEIFPSDLKADPEKLGIRQKFQTRPWPGFPTDLLSPLIVLGTQTKGTILFHDWMYETRMFFTDKLISMGANITLCDPHRCLVSGPTRLVGRHLASPDIRAGMSMLIAALCAKGESFLDHSEIIERGYQNPVGRFSSLAAQIEEI